MTIDVNTPENPEMKTVALEDLTGPEIVIPEGITLPATHRCDLCGVQAWVEVEMHFTRTTLHLNTEDVVGSGKPLLAVQEANQSSRETVLLCAHHYGDSEAALKEQAARIVDYRPTLVKQEKAGGPAL